MREFDSCRGIPHGQLEGGEMHAFGQVVNSCRHSASPLKSARRRYSGRKTGASAEASGVGVVPLTERGRV